LFLVTINSCNIVSDIFGQWPVYIVLHAVHSTASNAWMTASDGIEKLWKKILVDKFLVIC
jgi:hypothetical protein